MCVCVCYDQREANGGITREIIPMGWKPQVTLGVSFTKLRGDGTPGRPPYHSNEKRPAEGQS